MSHWMEGGHRHSWTSALVELSMCCHPETKISNVRVIALALPDGTLQRCFAVKIGGVVHTQTGSCHTETLHQ